jgi:prepilin-type N-terminal cleavage/methylation domain-containing protein
MTTSSLRPAARGFSLVEIMVTMTVFGLVMAGALPFFVSNLKYQFVGEQKLLINNDIRRITNELVENAREANSFTLYRSFYNHNNYTGAPITRDVNGNGSVTWADRLLNGQAGDFLVLVYYRDPYFDSRFFDGTPGNSPVLTNGQVTRLVGYYVAPNRRIPGEYALYSFDTDLSRGPTDTTWTTPWGATFPATLSSVIPQPSGTTTVEALLPAATSAWAQNNAHRIVINDLNGLAMTPVTVNGTATTTGFSFFNFQNRSVIVRTKILHGNQAKRVTNTYNFTITPRG